MNLIIIGPPGGGKGTYSDRISEEYDIPHIASGDIFRREIKKESELGEKVEEYLENGDLVPDRIVNKVMESRLSESDCDQGFILDGYPRTLDQAMEIEDTADIDLVINLDVAEEVLINRLSSRRVCEDCDEIYNLQFLPPEEEDTCDECGGRLYQREDDKPEVIKKRLEEYREKSHPLIEYYREKDLVVDIDIPEERPIEEIIEEMKTAIDEKLNI